MLPWSEKFYKRHNFSNKKIIGFIWLQIKEYVASLLGLYKNNGAVLYGGINFLLI